MLLLEEKVSSETFIEVYPIHHTRNYCSSLFYSLERKGKDASKKVTAKRAAQLLRTGKPDEAPVPIFASHMELKDIQLKETSTAQITT